METALIIGGHPRSGTTLLRNLCHGHADIMVTLEFGNFIDLDQPYLKYSYRLLKRWRRFWYRSYPVDSGVDSSRLLSMGSNYWFTFRYWLALSAQGGGYIDAPRIEAAMRRCLPGCRIIGDKLPYYVFLLDKLAQAEGLTCLFIYRDCRDVTSSGLEKVRTAWSKQGFAVNYNSAEKIARRWVQSMELLERYADKLHIICYEDLVRQPDRELEAVGRYLQVDPAGFPAGMVVKNRVGKYRQSLSPAELETVMTIAGPTMSRWGYK